MGKIYELSFERDFKDEVAVSVKTAFMVNGTKKVSDYLNIDDGYAREIASARGVPLGNLERCIKALGIMNNEYYYAVVVPYGFTRRYNLPEDGLKVFSLQDISGNKRPINYFESELFDADNKLYREALRYWRYHVYNGRTTISAMCDYTGLSDRTIINARHLNLNPRCSTIQKLLAIYGNSLIIIKSPYKLNAKHIKIKY